LGIPPTNVQQTFQAAPLTGIQTGATTAPMAAPWGQQLGTTAKPQTPLQPPQQRSPQRINPAQIPSPISIDTKSIIKYTSVNDGNAPPSAVTQFVAADQGNCNPRFMRMTNYTIPTSNDLQTASGLPFGVIVQPLAELQPGEVCFNRIFVLANDLLL
jgi:protein transport protein SEC24